MASEAYNAYGLLERYYCLDIVRVKELLSIQDSGIRFTLSLGEKNVSVQATLFVRYDDIQNTIGEIYFLWNCQVQFKKLISSMHGGREGPTTIISVHN